MAIKLNDGTVLRNLQEQVLENKKNIEAHYEIDRTLADYGIRIIGFYNTIEDAIDELGDPYDGPYGNAIGIGIAAPYTFYIWTRANNLSSVDYWQDVGQLAVVGPQGIQGEQGEQGIPGQPARIFTGNGVPTVSANENDIYMCVGGDPNLIGNIYKIVNGVWTIQGNVRGPQGPQGDKGWTGQRGPQGPQGEKGDAGDPGGFIKIAGIITDLGELPNPTVLKDLEVAFLHGTEAPYDLWMQVGPNYEQAIWTNMGPLNTATYVSVGGQYQGIWDADTKLDKRDANDGEYHAYIISDDGSQDLMNIATSADPESIVMRDDLGHIEVPLYPDLAEHATSKQYVDGLIVDSDTITTYWEGPDLSLNLSADIVADISRSVKVPVQAPSSNSFVRMRTDGGYDLVSVGTYMPSSSLITTSQTTTTDTTLQKTNKFSYTAIPAAKSASASGFQITLTQVGASSANQVSNVKWLEVRCIDSSAMVANIIYQSGSSQTTMVLLCSSIAINASATNPVRIYKTTWTLGSLT